MAAKGQWFLDGMDLYLNFGLIIKKGTADFLQYAQKKDSIEHDWLDSDGLDVDLTAMYFQKREITLQCAIIGDTETLFWQYHDKLISQLKKPGLHRLSFTSHPGRNYMVYYKSAEGWAQELNLKGQLANKTVQSFSLTVVEPNPNINIVQVAIASDNGRVIIT